MNQDTKYFHAFNLIEEIGPLGFKKLLKHFFSLKDAWFASETALKYAGLENDIIQRIKKQRAQIDPDLEIAKLVNQKIDCLIVSDQNYPKLLKEIYNPPAILYLRGSLNSQDNCIGIVGTRNLSDYGQQITPEITSQLAQAGLAIVSGLARGIDTLAHQTALENQARTIAVLGSGIDDQSIYPAENKKLAQDITDHGAVISEFPPGTSPKAQHFPQRNRIISGLSLGVLVIEAPDKSGALITCKEAVDQNREVFAVPGPINSKTSSGTNNLIRMGAKLVTQAQDILEEFNLNH